MRIMIGPSPFGRCVHDYAAEADRWGAPKEDQWGAPKEDQWGAPKESLLFYSVGFHHK